MAPAAAELSRTDPASHVRITPRPSRRPSRGNERSVPGGITHPASSFLDFRSRPRLQNEREMPVRPAAVMFGRTVIAISPRLAPRRVSSASNPSHRQLRVKHNARQRSRFCDSPGDDSSGFAALHPSARHFRRYSQIFFAAHIRSSGRRICACGARLRCCQEGRRHTGKRHLHMQERAISSASLRFSRELERVAAVVPNACSLKPARGAGNRCMDAHDRSPHTFP
jgi:hypothetical protein